MSSKCFHCKDKLWDEADHEMLELLKAELARERLAVDFYANKDSWDHGNEFQYSRLKITNDSDVQEWEDPDGKFTSTIGGKLARETKVKRANLTRI